MKKIFASILATALVATLSVAASAADFTASSALNNEIVVDGVKDLAYVSASVAIDVIETEPAGGATGNAYMAWDNDYLYVFAEVTDEVLTSLDTHTSIWSNDSLEVYLNLSGEEGEITAINAAQYTAGPNYTAWAGGGLHRDNNMDASSFAWVETDAGYDIEFAIAWGDDYTAAEGATFPFCLGINDDADGDGATREFHNFAASAHGTAFSTADSTWDNLTLSAEEYVEPEPETVAEVVDEAAAPATFDAGIIAAVAAVVSAAGYAISKKR